MDVWCVLGGDVTGLFLLYSYCMYTVSIARETKKSQQLLLLHTAVALPSRYDYFYYYYHYRMEVIRCTVK